MSELTTLLGGKKMLTPEMEQEFPCLTEQIKEATELRDQMNEDLLSCRETLKRIQLTRADTQRQFDEMERRSNEQILRLEDNVANMNRVLTDLIQHLKSEGRA